MLHEHGAILIAPPGTGKTTVVPLALDGRTVGLSTACRRADLAKVSVTNTVRALLPWPAVARLDELTQERIEVPSGKRITVDYTGERPVLAMPNCTGDIRNTTGQLFHHP